MTSQRARLEPQQGPKMPPAMLEAIVREHLKELDAEQDAIVERIRMARHALGTDVS